MENCGIGYQNLILSAALTADSSVAALPVSNLTSPQGSSAYAWRALGTQATLTVQFAQASSVRAVSLHRTNLTAGASWRLVLRLHDAVVQDVTTAMATTGGQATFVFPPDLVADAVQITISDATNPDGYLSVPLAYVGPLWQPIRNFSTDSTSGFNLGVDEVTALSGAEFPQMRWIQKKASIAHQSYGSAEADILSDIQAVAARGENILFIPDPSAPALQKQAIYGRLSGGDLGNPFGAADRRSWTFNMTERL